MSYLPQFKNDVFVSYRHASNESPDVWVDAFCAALRLHLLEQVGQVEIYQDKTQVHAGDNWRQDVADALNNAAIFLAIISRSYFDSDECRKELDTFLRQIKDDRLRKDDKLHMIVPVLKQPPKDDQDLPPELGEIQRYQFFQWDPPGTRNFKELGPNADKDVQSRFDEALARLAQDLMFALEDLKGRARKNVFGKVFVATVGPELDVERNSLRADLRQRGFEVVPEHVYLWNADNFRERLASDLEAAALCIHLVAQTESIEPETTERARLQLEQATQTCRRLGKPLPTVWIRPQNETHPSARPLIDYIQKELSKEGVEYWEGGLEDFKTQVYDKLPRPSAVTAVASGVREVALLVEQDDIAATKELTELLSGQLGMEANRVKFIGSVPEDAAYLAKTLERCRQCVIFWGGRPESWVRDLMVLTALAGHLGRERLCVLAATPATAEKTTFESLKACTIQGAEGSPEAELRTFFAAAEVPP